MYSLLKVSQFESTRVGVYGKCSKISNSSHLPQKRRKNRADPDQTASVEAV